MALEYLLQRTLARDGDPRRLRVECEGFREARDAWLGARTAALAREVLADRQARQMEALNAYDRRIVHMAAAAIDGVRTFSVGDGADRRVTIAAAE
jgi:spoIIIJ-associated protein